MPIILLGDEFDPYTNIVDLRGKVLNHCAGMKEPIVNLDTGHEILVTTKGVKHTMCGAGIELVKSLHALPQILESAMHTAREPDSRGRPDIVWVHKYAGEIVIADKALGVVLTVREMRDGQFRYYDHGFIKK